jgi:hypothetical protein
MQSKKFEELYNYLKSRDDIAFDYEYLHIIECNFNVENTIRITFYITETNDTFSMTYEVNFANIAYRKDFTGSLDETKEEINKITNKAMTLVETLKSMVRDTF